MYLMRSGEARLFTLSQPREKISGAEPSFLYVGFVYILARSPLILARFRASRLAWGVEVGVGLRAAGCSRLEAFFCPVKLPFVCEAAFSLSVLRSVFAVSPALAAGVCVRTSKQFF